MKIAIIGAGNVGGSLGTTWARKAGHEIFFLWIDLALNRGPGRDRAFARVMR